MTITLSPGIIMTGLAGASICLVPIRANQTELVRIDYMSCCVENISLCIAQNADKTYSFSDNSGVDFSAATEISFTIWESRGDGVLVLDKTLSAGDITLASPTVFQLHVTHDDSSAMTPTRKYCEVWVTLLGGEQRLTGAGHYLVEDTRKFD